MSETNVSETTTPRTTDVHPLRAALDAAIEAEKIATLAWQEDDTAPSNPLDPAYATALSYRTMKACEIALEAVRVAVVDSECPREWDLGEAGYHYDTVTADSAAEALEIAISNVDRANYDTDGDLGTIWIDVTVRCPETKEESSAKVTLEPEEPACSDERGHDWQSPYEILGGLKENPGVFGHGGGVIIRECCMRCGCGRTTDTWAQRPDTGEQGLRSVRYEPGEYSEEIGEVSSCPDELVVIETMPDCHRASHRAAGNWGVYPMNGAERFTMTRSEADEIVAGDPDEYAHIVGPADSGEVSS